MRQTSTSTYENGSGPTESQIQVLMSDWLFNLREGVGSGFTHRGKGGIRNGGGVSNYLIASPESLCQPELIRQGRRAAESVINAVLRDRVRITVGDDGSWSSKDKDTTTINIATDYFDDRALTAREKVDVMLGLASHEAAHGEYTDFDSLERAMKNTAPELRQLRHSIQNIIEDERVEYLLGEDYPGLSELMAATKGYYFGRTRRKMMEAGGGQMPRETLPRFLNTLLLAVRYPSEMTREDAEENFDNLDAVRRILTPYPMTPAEVDSATRRILEVIRDLARQEIQEQAEPGKDGADGVEDPEPNLPLSMEEDENNEKDSQGGNTPENEDGDTGETETGKNQGGGSRDGSPAGPEVSEDEVTERLRGMASSEQARKVLQAIEEDIEKGNGRNTCSTADDRLETEYINSEDAEVKRAGNGRIECFLRKPKGDHDRYLRSLSPIRAYIPAMSKALSCKAQESEYELNGLPSGRLNTNKLVSLKAGNTSIFTRKGTVTCSGACVIALIDESGSMSGDNEEAARRTAILISEAVARIPNVDFYCYGYTTSELNIYSEAGRTSRWALSDIRASGGTPTGDAMENAMDRVRGCTDAPALMLVITDGYPDSAAKVIRQDADARRRDIHPIGIGINSDAVKSTFREWVVMNDISTLAPDIARIARRRLDKMLVRTDSMD